MRAISKTPSLSAAECSSPVQQRMALSGSAEHFLLSPPHCLPRSCIHGTDGISPSQRGVTLFVRDTSVQPAQDSNPSIPAAAPGRLPPWKSVGNKAWSLASSDSAHFKSNCSCHGLHLLWCFSSDKFSSEIKL